MRGFTVLVIKVGEVLEHISYNLLSRQYLRIILISLVYRDVLGNRLCNSYISPLDMVLQIWMFGLCPIPMCKMTTLYN